MSPMPRRDGRKPAGALRIISWNIRRAWGCDHIRTAGRVSADKCSDLGADLLLAQETGTAPKDKGGATHTLRQLYRPVKAWVHLTDPHCGDVHAVGGLGCVAWGSVASRMRVAEADARGWDRYTIVRIQGRGGRSLVIANLYCPVKHAAGASSGEGTKTRAGPDVTGDSMWAQMVRLAEAAVGDGEASGKRRRSPLPGELRAVKPEDLDDPRSLMLEDLAAQLSAEAKKPLVTIMVIGDTNMDGSDGGAAADMVASLCRNLRLAEVPVGPTTNGSQGGRAIDRCFLSAAAVSCGKVMRVAVSHDQPADRISDHNAVVIDVDADGVLGTATHALPAQTRTKPFRLSDRVQRARFKEIAAEVCEEAAWVTEAEEAAKQLGSIDAAEARKEWDRTNSAEWRDREVEKGGVRDLITQVASILYDAVEKTKSRLEAEGPKRESKKVGDGRGKRTYGDGWSPAADANFRMWKRARAALTHIEAGDTGAATFSLGMLAAKGLVPEWKSPNPDWSVIRTQVETAATEVRKKLHGKQREADMAKLSPKSRKRLRARAVAASRGIIDAMLERKRDGPPAALQTPDGDLVTEPADMARMAVDFGNLRGNDAQPHWCAKYMRGDWPDGCSGMAAGAGVAAEGVTAENRTQAEPDTSRPTTDRRSLLTH